MNIKVVTIVCLIIAIVVGIGLVIRTLLTPTTDIIHSTRNKQVNTAHTDNNVSSSRVNNLKESPGKITIYKVYPPTDYDNGDYEDLDMPEMDERDFPVQYNAEHELQRPVRDINEVFTETFKEYLHEHKQDIEEGQQN